MSCLVFKISELLNIEVNWKLAAAAQVVERVVYQEKHEKQLDISTSIK